MWGPMKPWSHSSLEKYETCARQFHEIKVLKSVVEPETEHQKWGKDVHTAFEECLKSDGRVRLPHKMRHWQLVADQLLAIPSRKIFTELEVSLDSNFKPAPWDDCWTRGVLDVLVLGDTTAIVLDWKTGKRKPTEQLKLYAAYVFALYPQITTVHTALVWLKDKRIDKDTVERFEAPLIWRGYIERVARLTSAYERDSWPERPSGLCKAHCVVTDCKYNGTRK